MGKYVLRRLLATVPVLLGVSVLVFSIVHLIPGDPALILAGMEASEAQVARVRQDLGLDRPLHVQYLTYVTRALRGDLGRSIHSRQQIWQAITEHFPATLELTVASLLLSSVVGIVVGVVSAVKRYSLFDHLSMLGALAGISMPIFWIGILLMWFFSLYLEWLPTGGRSGPAWTLAGLRSLVLPSLALAGISVAMIARLTRSTMLEILRQEFVTTARSKGLGERLVIFRHALGNALIPVVTYLGLEFGVLLGGAVVTEQIFSWPGMGRLVVDAINSRDYPIIQGCILFFAVLFVLINLMVDLLYGLLDPRIRYE
jgi:peptide/nickel transport system permease protein